MRALLTLKFYCHFPNKEIYFRNFHESTFAVIMAEFQDYRHGYILYLFVNGSSSEAALCFYNCFAVDI